MRPHRKLKTLIWIFGLGATRLYKKTSKEFPAIRKTKKIWLHWNNDTPLATGLSRPRPVCFLGSASNVYSYS